MLFMEWKDILRELLDKHGITAAELSRRSKVSPSDISRYLSGERTEPAFSVVLKIANALGEPMPGGTRTIEQGMIAARIQRDPEVEDFVREWQNLPDEAREVTRELVRILGRSRRIAMRPKGREKQKPDAKLPHYRANYLGVGGQYSVNEDEETYTVREEG